MYKLTDTFISALWYRADDDFYLVCWFGDIIFYIETWVYPFWFDQQNNILFYSKLPLISWEDLKKLLPIYTYTVSL